MLDYSKRQYINCYIGEWSATTSFKAPDAGVIIGSHWYSAFLSINGAYVPPMASSTSSGYYSDGDYYGGETTYFFYGDVDKGDTVVLNRYSGGGGSALYIGCYFIPFRKK